MAQATVHFVSVAQKTARVVKYLHIAGPTKINMDHYLTTWFWITSAERSVVCDQTTSKWLRNEKIYCEAQVHPLITHEKHIVRSDMNTRFA